MKAVRFSDKDMPFRLFEAPIELASVKEAGSCGACGAGAAYLFGGTCYACFREGKARQTIDTELGMVQPDDAERGMTHGIPLSDPGELAEYELVPQPVDPNFPDEHWYSVKIDSEELRELTRTPKYLSWQGERWLFCCGKPCVFTGQLTYQTIDAMEQAVVTIATIFGESVEQAEHIIDHIEDDSLGTYLFRCQVCSRVRGHYDMS